jgi:hypothetical protein
LRNTRDYNPAAYYSSPAGYSPSDSYPTSYCNYTADETRVLAREATRIIVIFVKTSKNLLFTAIEEKNVVSVSFATCMSCLTLKCTNCDASTDNTNIL